MDNIDSLMTLVGAFAVPVLRFVSLVLGLALVLAVVRMVIKYLRQV